MSFDDNTNITVLPSPSYAPPCDTKVLVLEDNLVDRNVMTRAAKQSDMTLEFQFVETLAQMTEMVQKHRFDLAILDYRLPDGTGLDAIKLLTGSALNYNCANIMVASEAEITIAVAAMKSGCSDYILKEDLTPAALRHAIINALQKSELRKKVSDASQNLVSLRSTLREHSELSTTFVRPMIRRTLAQVSALEFSMRQTGQSPTDMRLEIITENCRDVLNFCDKIERDGVLAGPNPAL